MNKDGKRTTNWSEKISERAERIGRSVIRELLNVANQEGVISFAGGLSASEMLPLETTKKVVAGFNERKVLQYCSTEGIADLRSYLARNTFRYGIEAETDNILPTAGSQQALDQYGVAFVYGSAFLPNREKSSSMRLNFSYMEPSKIKQGIERLGEAINDYL